MQDKQSQCCYKNESLKGIRKYKLFGATLLLALLPKCPFCLFAYSTTIVLCSKTHTEFYSSPVTIAITSLFCLLILGSILLNFRQDRTFSAFALASIGSFFVIYSVAIDGGQILYYLGVFILFFSVWLNGSFYWFLNKIRNQKTFQI